MKKTELQKMVAMMVAQAKEFNIVNELHSELGKAIEANNDLEWLAGGKTLEESISVSNSTPKVATKVAKTTTPKVAPKVEVAPTTTPKREYGLPVFKNDGRFVSYCNEDGSYLAHKGVRQVLNVRIKTLGGTWNRDLRTWEFSSIQKAKLCIKNIDRVVTQEQLDEVAQTWKAQAQAKADRKAARK